MSQCTSLGGVGLLLLKLLFRVKHFFVVHDLEKINLASLFSVDQGSKEPLVVWGGYKTLNNIVHKFFVLEGLERVLEFGGQGKQNQILSCCLSWVFQIYLPKFVVGREVACNTLGNPQIVYIICEGHVGWECSLNSINFFKFFSEEYDQLVVISPFYFLFLEGVEENSPCVSVI